MQPERVGVGIAIARDPQEKIGLEARKRLTLELFKSGREGLKNLILDSYIKELPILGPLHDILASALDKSAKDLIDRKADAIASSMPRERNALDTSLSEAAREVSRSVTVEVNPRTLARYNRPLAEWRAETKTVASLKARAPMEVLRAQTPKMRAPVESAAQLDRLPLAPSRSLPD